MQRKTFARAALSLVAGISLFPTCRSGGCTRLSSRRA